MIALGLAVIAGGLALLYAAGRQLQTVLDAIEAQPGKPDPDDAAGDWGWPVPDPQITHRKAHNGTENRPT
jgi:hypothetical protein